jgi:hypothetical protein
MKSISLNPLKHGIDCIVAGSPQLNRLVLVWSSVPDHTVTLSYFPLSPAVWGKRSEMKRSEMCKVKVKLSLCLTNSALHHEGEWGSGCINPHFLDLGTSWRCVVCFTPLLLYPRVKSLRYPLHRRLGGPQSQSGRHREENNLDPTGTRTPTLRSSSP